MYIYVGIINIYEYIFIFIVCICLVCILKLIGRDRSNIILN